MDKQKEYFQKLFRSPIFLIKEFWGLFPQPLICEKQHKHTFNCYGEFVLGQHITWQQTQVLEAIEAGKNRISVRSGNGIGKDALLSWLIHWYLFTHYRAQIGCTAPSADQLYDVLWKELSVWNQKLPETIKKSFEWTTDRYRLAEAPEIRGAIARTARRETPESFAGLHGKYVCLLGDEASAIDDAIFSAGEGALTGENTLVVLVWNPTRLEGFFYETHTKFKDRWTIFAFNGEESPIVRRDFVEETIAKYGRESDEFRWKVQGEFPKAEGMDLKGWMPLLSEAELKFCPDVGSFKSPALGIDPSGEGSNKTAMVVRDAFMAKIVLEEQFSTPKGIADKALTFGIHYSISVERMVIDSFGAGSNVGMEISLSSGERPRAVNVGERADDPERFVNMRAELYWRLREGILKGGQLVNHPHWKQLLTIRYKRTGAGKIQIISKSESKTVYGFESPDCFIAGTLVKTPKGNRRIETLKVGEEVYSPFGTYKIIKVWEVETNKLTTVSFSNGSVITGKGAHGIFTKRGFVCLDALTLTDMIDTWQNRILWKLKRCLFFRDESIGFRELANTFTTTDISELARKIGKRKRYITQYGNFLQDKLSQKELLYTIKTKILSTMLLKILNSKRLLCIVGNIWQKTLRIANCMA